ncbi:MAG: phosphatase PAP2 family protein [Acidimicrobiia bacterium]
MKDLVSQVDSDVDAFVETHQGPLADRLFYSLSSAADHSILWHAIGITAAVVRRDKRFAFRFALALGLESALTNGVIKPMVGRVRPETDDGPLPHGLRRPKTSSFPSGHATSAFMATSVLANGARAPRKVLLGMLAAAVASSRVYTRMHHASDVAAGTVLGLGFGAIAKRYIRLRSHLA